MPTSFQLNVVQQNTPVSSESAERTVWEVEVNMPPGVDLRRTSVYQKLLSINVVTMTLEVQVKCLISVHIDDEKHRLEVEQPIMANSKTQGPAVDQICEMLLEDWIAECPRGGSRVDFKAGELPVTSVNEAIPGASDKWEGDLYIGRQTL